MTLSKTLNACLMSSAVSLSLSLFTIRLQNSLHAATNIIFSFPQTSQNYIIAEVQKILTRLSGYCGYLFPHQINTKGNFDNLNIFEREVTFYKNNTYT